MEFFSFKWNNHKKPNKDQSTVLLEMNLCSWSMDIFSNKHLIMKNTRLTHSQEIVAFYKHRRTGLLACFDWCAGP